MAEELYCQSADGGEITAIPLDQIPSLTLNTAGDYDHPNWGATIDYTPRDLDGWTTINYSTYDPNAWTATATPGTPYLQVDGDGFVRWYQNGQPIKTYGWPDNNFTFRYPSESTPVDTHELDEFIDSLKVVEGEDDV